MSTGHGVIKLQFQKNTYSTPCKFWVRGICAKGSACPFSHDGGQQQYQQVEQPPPIRLKQQLQPFALPLAGGGGGVGSSGNVKTIPCKFYAMGVCTRGSSCTFSHGEQGYSGVGTITPASQGYSGVGTIKLASQAYPATGMVSTTTTTITTTRSTGGDRYYTPCKFFLMGTCTKGAQCTFAHCGIVVPSMLGKGKGKGKPSAMQGQGHLLPRTRLTQDGLSGTIIEWKGKYGWIQPTDAIDHPKAAKHNGRIWVSIDDINGLSELTPGASCMFQLWEDASGLGAEECFQF